MRQRTSQRTGGPTSSYLIFTARGAPLIDMWTSAALRLARHPTMTMRISEAMGDSEQTAPDSLIGDALRMRRRNVSGSALISSRRLIVATETVLKTQICMGNTGTSDRNRSRLVQTSDGGGTLLARLIAARGGGSANPKRPSLEKLATPPLEVATGVHMPIEVSGPIEIMTSRCIGGRQ